MTENIALRMPGLIRGTYLAFGVVAVVIALWSGMLVAKPAHAKTFTVNFTTDASDAVPGDGSCNVIFGVCTLRAAIQEANAFAGADTIVFEIPGGGVQTIEPGSALPEIERRVTINGYTQSGAEINTIKQGATNAKLRVQLDGSSAGVVSPGLQISANSVVIRGLVINRFEYPGIRFTAGTGGRVEGNFIGTDHLGTVDLGNASGMIVVGSDHTIGGTKPAARNLISGNDTSGVSLFASGSKVEGNLIGTNASGTAKLGNADTGVSMSDGPNTVGGTTPAARNIISGNGSSDDINSAGVFILASDNNKVQGNYIGTSKDGTGDLGNSWGVLIRSASDNTVGGADAGTSNTIAHNDLDGVQIESSNSSGNRILRNSIHSNLLGLDLVGGNETISGNTINDPCDGDTGPNTLQNYPEFTSATTSGAKTTIKGKLNSKPNKTFVLRFFSNPQGSPAEGKKYIGSKSVSTNANCNTGIFTFTPNKAVAVGQVISATATNIAGNTSEVSLGKQVS